MKSKYSLEEHDSKYFFHGIEISRQQHQKIKFGNWGELSYEIVLKKIKNQSQAKKNREGYQILYQEALSFPEGQYYLGMGLIKVANDLKKMINRLNSEGRSLMKNNKGKI